MYFPQSQIKTNLSTNGGEFVTLLTNENYNQAEIDAFVNLTIVAISSANVSALGSLSYRSNILREKS